jgi:hypothetical protein
MYLTYRAKDLSSTHELILLGLLDAVEVEDKLREELSVVSLPLADGFEVVGHSLRLLGLLGGSLVLTGCLELPSQSSGGGTATADESMAAGFSIVDLDDLLLGGRLAVGHVALFTRVRALALSSDVWASWWHFASWRGARDDWP